MLQYDCGLHILVPPRPRGKLSQLKHATDCLPVAARTNAPVIVEVATIHNAALQGLCKGVVAEQRDPSFSPRTLNYRVRQREMIEIDHENLALMHRLEKASSYYKRSDVRPKHFQEPNRGLFPR